MKKFVLFLGLFGLIFSGSAYSKEYLGSYACLSQGKTLRTNHDGGVVDARFYFRLWNNDEGAKKISELVGHVTVSPWEEKLDEDAYYSVFSLKNIVENTKYRPRVYKNHTQFKDIASSGSSRVDGGMMWGEFVIEKDRSKETFKAHYIFQSGDHLGGTIDYTCKKY